jgi:two-component sensor histidine kinase
MNRAVVPSEDARARRESRRRLARMLRDAIWRMRSPEDMEEVLHKLRDGLLEAGLPLLNCGVNRVAVPPPNPVVVSHTLNRAGRWNRLESGVQTVVDFWQSDDIVYRGNLDEDDPFDEKRYMKSAICVVDVPFAQGTLAVNSHQAHAFSEYDLDVLRETAGLLEDGFRRLDEIRRADVRLKIQSRIWAMRDVKDIEDVVVTLRESFDGMGFRYNACAINLVERDPTSGEYVVMEHNMTRGGDWTRMEPRSLPLVVDFWKRGEPAYRRDLALEDEHAEQGTISKNWGLRARSVVDIPFSHGTLALNSTEPDAFSEDQLALLSDMAGLLDTGFRRLDDLKVLQERNGQLQQEVDERRRAEERLATSLEEREVLLREVHHRVKNNLQVVCSLLSLRAEGLTDIEAMRSFTDSRAQIESMALIHERLYETADLTQLEGDAFVGDLCRSVFASYGVDVTRIALDLDIAPGAVSVEAAIEGGLIVHELVSNSLKHAFPGGRPGRIRVCARLQGSDTVLVVEDDGVGLPETARPEHSMGLRLVDDLTRKLAEQLTVTGDGGTRFEVRYPTRGRLG